MSDKRRMNLSLRRVAAEILDRTPNASAAVERLVMERVADLANSMCRVRAAAGPQHVPALLYELGPYATAWPRGFEPDFVREAIRSVVGAPTAFDEDDELVEHALALAHEVALGDEGLPIPGFDPEAPRRTR